MNIESKALFGGFFIWLQIGKINVLGSGTATENVGNFDVYALLVIAFADRLRRDTGSCKHNRSGKWSDRHHSGRTKELRR